MSKFKYTIFLSMALLALAFAIPAQAADSLDSDKDGLPDTVEVQLGTDIYNADTDNDGFTDKEEAVQGYNPHKGGGDRSMARRVEVDLSSQTLTYYLGNAKIGTAPVSTGLIRTPTPTGEFSILRKVPVIRYRGIGYDYPNTKYNLEFKRSYYLHTAYWHNQFGIKPMSHGCVNISYRDTEKLYQFLDVGDKVMVIGKTPTKPLVQSVAINK